MFATTLLLAALTAAPDSQPVAFVDVSVIPMDRERVLEHYTVVVRDGRIVAFGPVGDIQVPRGAARVDGRGKYLMPGFAEMHGHLPNPQAPGTTPELVESVLFLYVANGVTAVRGMQGNPGALVIRDRIARGELVGPRLWVAGPALGGSALTPDSARRLVEAQRTRGRDLPPVVRQREQAWLRTAHEPVQWRGHGCVEHELRERPEIGGRPVRRQCREVRERVACRGTCRRPRPSAWCTATIGSTT